eukprot:UN20822
MLLQRSTFGQHLVNTCMFRIFIGTCRVPKNQTLTLKHRVDAFIIIHVKINDFYEIYVFYKENPLKSQF